VPPKHAPICSLLEPNTAAQHSLSRWFRSLLAESARAQRNGDKDHQLQRRNMLQQCCRNPKG